MSDIVITGPSSSLWTTSLPFRVAVDPTIDPDKHAYFSREEHARAFLDRNWYLPREVELSPRFALAPGELHPADEPEAGRAPSAGQVAMAELYGSSSGEV